MRPQGELWRNNPGRRAARASFSSLGSSRAQSSTLGILLAWTGANTCCSVHASRGAGSRRAHDAAGGLLGQWGGQDQPARAKRKATRSTSRSSSLSGLISKRSSQPNSRIQKNLFSACPFAIAAQLRPTNESAGFERERSGGTLRRPRCLRRERWRRCRRNPTCLYSHHVHESICLWLPCP